MGNVKYNIESLDSEAGVIASLIHHPEYRWFCDRLLPNHFSDTGNRCIYTAVTGLADMDIKTIDAYNIMEYLSSTEATKSIAKAVTLDRIKECCEMSDVLARHSQEEFTLCVNNVLDAAFRRDAIKKLEECERLCADRDTVDIEKKIYEAIDGVVSEFSRAEEIPSFGDVVDELWDEVVAHQDGNEAGIPYKFRSLAPYTCIEPGELAVVSAPAKGAKSMLMLNEAVDILRMGKSVMYIDSELSDRLFLCRMVSHLTKIQFFRVRSGRYSEEEAEAIRAALDWIKAQPFVHIYIPIFDQQAVYLAVKKIVHKLGKLDVLIVDYIKATGDSTDAYATYAELGKFVDLIKNNICGDMGIAGLAAAQLTAAGKLADSAKIARNASVIMTLLDKTPGEIEADGRECGNKKLQVVLNRNGKQHFPDEYISLEFDGDIISLEEAKQAPPRSPF